MAAFLIVGMAIGGYFGYHIKDDELYNDFRESISYCEEERGQVLRVYESEGRETKCKIVSSLKIDRCFESNCLEEPIAELTVAGNSFEVNLSPFEIKTFVVALHC